MTADPRALIATWRSDFRETSPDYWSLVERADTLLTGYASALDEVDRLRAEASKEAAATHELAEEHEKHGMDLAFHRGGHRAALAELVTLRTSLAEHATIARLTQLASERYEEAEEVHALAGDAIQGARPTIAALRQEVGELKLVIEQQDRDMARMRVALREALDLADVPEHRQGSDWSARRDALDALDAILNQGAPCTTK